MKLSFIALLIIVPSVQAASIRDIAIAAIRADGQPVQEILTDSIASYIHTKFDPLAPVIAKGVLVRNILPKGCARVRVDINQAGFKLNPIEFNYCVDGSIPMPENMQGGK